MHDPFDLSDPPFDPLASPHASRAPDAEPWLEKLNPQQFTAVTTTKGPLLVLSGAGTGKTRVLTSRLAHILSQRLAQPWQCLCVTFTNKAAREMRERVADLVGPMAESLWLGTFHALCVRLLRRHGELVGLKSNFIILDSDDQLRLLKQIMDSNGIDLKKWPPQALMAIVQRWKDRALLPDKVGQQSGADYVQGRAVDLYRQYQDRLLAVNACDFGDLLLHCLTIFLRHSDVLQQYQEQFHYILVDEYQDTNVAQYLWLRLLAQKHGNICCVGDDDQSIYSWRGAEVGNILKFDHDFPNAVMVRLESNYRSSAHILAAASHLIAHNQDRLGKTLRPGSPDQDQGAEKIQIRGVWDGPEEARIVCDTIEDWQRQGQSLSGIAILVRAGFQTREFEERLITTGIPYRIIGGARFYERQEIRDAMAYFRLVNSPDDSLAFERIVNLPKRGLGDAALQTIHTLSRAKGVPLFEAACVLLETDELKPKPRAALRGFVEKIQDWRRTLENASGAPSHHCDLARRILEESGYEAMWKADKNPESAGRVENLKELLRALADYDSLQSFLEHVALVMENDERQDVDKLVVMTLHGAKGLEFDCVVLPGWEDGVFPHQRALDEGGRAALEEERRLAYVGLTRARHRVLISFAANRRIYNQWQASLPSRFLDELPSEHIVRLSDRGVSVGRDSAAAFSRPVSPDWQKPHSGQASGANSGFAVGCRVFHQKFGQGRVVDMDGDRLEIQFDHAGLKKVLDSFVQLL